MENSTPFDLNEAMRQWRQIMSASPAFHPDDLDQLECHLRDSVAVLQTKGLSAREAFWVAKSRVGTIDELNCEFGKVNAEQVWLNRALWMVFGSVAIGVLSGVVSILVNLSAVAVFTLTGESRLLGPIGLVVYIGTFIGLLHWLWRSGRQSNGTVCHIGGWIKTHPIAAAISAFLIIEFISASVFGISFLMAHSLRVVALSEFYRWNLAKTLLQGFFWPVFLAWLLVRTRRTSVVQ
jgi:hypothetical protein